MKTTTKILFISMLFSAAIPLMLFASERASTKKLATKPLDRDLLSPSEIDALKKLFPNKSPFKELIHNKVPLKNWLTRTVFQNNLAMVKILMESEFEFEVNGQDLSGDTALGLAVIKENPAIVQLLLEKKANPNSKGRNSKGEERYSPLEIAKYLGYTEIVELLDEAE